MKFNWGWGIVIALTLFITMILQFVVRSFNERIDLVSDDYYEKELDYQSTIDKEKNLNLLVDEMEIKTSPDGLRIIFPEDLAENKISGTVSLYRPSDERLDKGYRLEDEMISEFLIPLEDLTTGKWVIKVDFSAADKDYYYEKTMVL